MNQPESVTASIRIDAAPADVFPYLTEASQLVRWMAAWVDVDPTPGGSFAVNIGEQPVRGTYIVVEPPHRVVFTWGLPGNEALPPGASTVEIVLTADGDETVVDLTHRDLPEDLRSDHLAGWTSLLDNLRATACSNPRAVHQPLATSALTRPDHVV
jgi:uncharacterized protein YndB with AHSA1/START domain